MEQPAGAGDDPTAASGEPSGAPRRASRRPPRTVVVGVLVAGLIPTVIASGATAVYDRHHPAVELTGPPVTLQQVGAAQAAALTPGSVADVAARLLPSVVTIEEKTATTMGTGSGVVIDGPKGYILTNNHVVADFAADTSHTATLKVIPNRGTLADALTARVVGRDPSSDLAVVAVSTQALQTAALGRSGGLRVGDAVIAIGAPLGLAGTVTEGIVSALGRNVGVPSETGAGAPQELTDAIQTDAAINPGNSGGALADAAGRVIGINSAIASAGSAGSPGGNIGVGFAIPVDEAAVIAAQLIEPPHRALHAFLGVRTQDSEAPAGAKISSVDDGSQNLPGVTPGSPAAKAGLREGDVITSFGGDPVSGADELLAAVRRHRVAEQVAVSYLRRGVRSTVTVTLTDNTSLH